MKALFCKHKQNNYRQTAYTQSMFLEKYFSGFLFVVSQNIFKFSGFRFLEMKRLFLCACASERGGVQGGPRPHWFLKFYIFLSAF